LEVKIKTKIFLRPENESSRNYYEIRPFRSSYVTIQLRYEGLKMDSHLEMIPLKIMASTGVFVRVVCALKQPISSFPCSQSTSLAYLRLRKSYSHQKIGPERDFYEGRQRAKHKERQPRIVVVNLMKLYT
jgi:hypothetical protein